MKHRQSLNAFVQPLESWTAVAVRTSETMIASAQVIGYRLFRMLAAAPEWSPRERREFAAMGLEKLQAGAASLFAMGNHMAVLNWQLGAQALSQMLSACVAASSFMGSRTAAEAMGRQARVLRLMSSMSSRAGRMSSDTARLVSRGLTPIRARAMRNAARLGRL